MKNLVIVIMMVVLAACGKKPQFIGVENVSVKGLKDTVMVIDLDYVIYNPNNLKTQLKESGMMIFFQDTLVGQGFLDHQIALSPQDTVNVPVRCEVSLKQLSRFYPKLLESDSSAFGLEGETSVHFLLNSFEIDVTDNIYLNTRKIISEEIKKNLGDTSNFKIEAITVESLPYLNKTKFKIEVQMHNNLPFDYQLDQLNLKFYLDPQKEAIAKWHLEAPISQQALGVANIPVAVSINNFSLFQQANLRWLTNMQADFLVVGDAEVLIEGYPFKVPINDSMSVDIKTLSGL